MTLREALADYLRVRRRLGFDMPQDGRLLERFVEFLEQAGAERITTELALKRARLPAGAHPHYWRQRLSVVRGFAWAPRRSEWVVDFRWVTPHTS
jgi:integrase/recombinase XerD